MSKPTSKEQLEALTDMVSQACSYDNKLDSMAISAFADAMRILADAGVLKIETDVGRRVIGHWIT